MSDQNVLVFRQEYREYLCVRMKRDVWKGYVKSKSYARQAVGEAVKVHPAQP